MLLSVSQQTCKAKPHFQRFLKPYPARDLFWVPVPGMGGGGEGGAESAKTIHGIEMKLLG